ncbi:MAG: hypothetical protein KME12_17980 [Trichocoleus desertorum ATA4-8-CV12]|jgi:hypothetical protein|nr:hypothetical protein [Trichocoleus desertorum ATA4-8-CV12]
MLLNSEGEDTEAPTKEPSSQFSQLSFQRTAMILTGLGFVLTLAAPYAKAGPLEELNHTLSQTVTNVTNQVLSPINQVQNTINGTVNQVEHTINQTITGAVNQVENTLHQAVGGAIDEVLGPIEDKIGSIFGGSPGRTATLLNPFQSLLRSFTTFLQNILNDLLGGSSGNGNSGSHGSGEPGLDISLNNPVGQIPKAPGDSGITPQVGALGLPDIQATHAAIDQMARQPNHPRLQKSDRFNTNPQAIAYSVKSESDRLASRGMAQTVIGTAGQQQMAADTQAASQALQSIQQTAAAAQTKDVTQDVMKDLTAMTAAQSSLSAGSYAQLMGVRQQMAADSVVNTNISEAADEANRMHHAERMGAALYVLNSAANFYLPGQTK